MDERKGDEGGSHGELLVGVPVPPDCRSYDYLGALAHVKAVRKQVLSQEFSTTADANGLSGTGNAKNLYTEITRKCRGALTPIQPKYVVEGTEFNGTGAMQIPYVKTFEEAFVKEGMPKRMYRRLDTIDYGALPPRTIKVRGPDTIEVKRVRSLREPRVEFRTRDPEEFVARLRQLGVEATIDPLAAQGLVILPGDDDDERDLARCFRECFTIETERTTVPGKDREVMFTPYYMDKDGNLQARECYVQQVVDESPRIWPIAPVPRTLALLDIMKETGRGYTLMAHLVGLLEALGYATDLDHAGRVAYYKRRSGSFGPFPASVGSLSSNRTMDTLAPMTLTVYFNIIEGFFAFNQVDEELALDCLRVALYGSRSDSKKLKAMITSCQTLVSCDAEYNFVPNFTVEGDNTMKRPVVGYVRGETLNTQDTPAARAQYKKVVEHFFMPVWKEAKESLSFTLPERVLDALTVTKLKIGVDSYAELIFVQDMLLKAYGFSKSGLKDEVKVGSNTKPMGKKYVRAMEWVFTATERAYPGTLAKAAAAFNVAAEHPMFAARSSATSRSASGASTTIHRGESSMNGTGRDLYATHQPREYFEAMMELAADGKYGEKCAALFGGDTTLARMVGRMFVRDVVGVSKDRRQVYGIPGNLFNLLIPIAAYFRVFSKVCRIFISEGASEVKNHQLGAAHSASAMFMEAVTFGADVSGWDTGVSKSMVEGFATAFINASGVDSKHAEDIRKAIATLYGGAFSATIRGVISLFLRLALNSGNLLTRDFNTVLNAAIEKVYMDRITRELRYNGAPVFDFVQMAAQGDDATGSATFRAAVPMSKRGDFVIRAVKIITECYTKIGFDTNPSKASVLAMSFLKKNFVGGVYFPQNTVTTDTEKVPAPHEVLQVTESRLKMWVSRGYDPVSTYRLIMYYKAYGDFMIHKDPSGKIVKAYNEVVTFMRTHIPGSTLAQLPPLVQKWLMKISPSYARLFRVRYVHTDEINDILETAVSDEQPTGYTLNSPLIIRGHAPLKHKGSSTIGPKAMKEMGLKTFQLRYHLDHDEMERALASNGGEFGLRYRAATLAEQSLGRKPLGWRYALSRHHKMARAGPLRNAYARRQVGKLSSALFRSRRVKSDRIPATPRVKLRSHEVPTPEAYLCTLSHMSPGIADLAERMHLGGTDKHARSYLGRILARDPLFPKTVPLETILNTLGSKHLSDKVMSQTFIMWGLDPAYAHEAVVACRKDLARMQATHLTNPDDSWRQQNAIDASFNFQLIGSLMGIEYNPTSTHRIHVRNNALIATNFLIWQSLFTLGTSTPEALPVSVPSA